MVTLCWPGSEYGIETTHYTLCQPVDLCNVYLLTGSGFLFVARFFLQTQTQSYFFFTDLTTRLLFFCPVFAAAATV